MNHILIMVVILILITPSFVFKKFGRLDLEQIIFLFVSDGAGADFSILGDYFKYALPIVLFTYIGIYIYKKLANKYGEIIYYHFQFKVIVFIQWLFLYFSATNTSKTL